MTGFDDLRGAAADLIRLLGGAGADGAGLAAMVAAVVQAQPAHAAARLALCSLLWEAGDRAGAIAQYRIIASQRHDDPDTQAALGVALVETGAWGEGTALLDALGDRVPSDTAILQWHAQGLWELGRTTGAIAALRRAVSVSPEAPLPHLNLAHRLLATGAWDEGWPEFAWRWNMDAAQRAWRRPKDPLHRPEPALWRGRTVLVFAEQGAGDTILCLRYLPLLRNCGARIVLEVQGSLARLVRWAAPDMEVVTVGSPAPAHDVAVPIFHLPWAFGTMPDSIPGQHSYLAASATDIAHWHEKVEPLARLRVGLIWAGASYRDDPVARDQDQRRSMSLAHLAPFAAVQGVDFVSLQVGEGAGDVASSPPGMVIHDWTDQLGDFADTAALMSVLDLVIAVDTGPMHLAAALGRPVWLLNRHDSCWRWLLGRDDSPWYPTLCQFRQSAPGDWADVVERVAEALRQRVSRT